mmetsp:Transcript_3443/g.9134  ORF Transcript_3443/g.9134 Transcript_3443/m.9134 type:complete len:85 (-) Transcript_3443:54-308(-)
MSGDIWMTFGAMSRNVPSVYGIPPVPSSAIERWNQKKWMQPSRLRCEARRLSAHLVFQLFISFRTTLHNLSEMATTTTDMRVHL